MSHGEDTTPRNQPNPNLMHQMRLYPEICSASLFATTQAETGNGLHYICEMVHLDGPAIGTFCSCSTSCPPTTTQVWAAFYLCILSPCRHKRLTSKKLTWIHCLIKREGKFWFTAPALGAVINQDSAKVASHTSACGLVSVQLYQ